jgi:hypothetical protein
MQDWEKGNSNRKTKGKSALISVNDMGATGRVEHPVRLVGEEFS